MATASRRRPPTPPIINSPSLPPAATSWTARASGSPPVPRAIAWCSTSCTTGITAYANGALKIYILKSVKEVISNNYECLFQQIKSGTSNDYTTLKTQYEQLKELELSIIRAYKDMNELDPEQQIQANEWIGEIENQSCGEV